MISYFFRIPAANHAAATALQREITGRKDDPPVFRLEQARGEIARLFAHVWLWTEDQTQAFVAALPGLGGVVRQTYPQDKEVVSKVETLGRRRRPDLALKTTPELETSMWSAWALPAANLRDS